MTTPYRAPRWLPGGNSQTIYAATLLPLPRVRYRRERWETPDGDFIDLDWIDGNRANPLVALFHGLEGGSHGHYARSLMAALQKAGWRGVVAHFRGCSGAPNRLPRAYHSGDSAEIDWVLRRLSREHSGSPLFTAGVSLGGNALLKWLGEQGAAARDVVRAAAAVSAPLDLHTAGSALEQGFNVVYTRNFLRSLKKTGGAKLKRFPQLFDARALEQARTLRQFDDLVTAPLHGFKDVNDYWTRASSKPWLIHIKVPTLVVNARNDPFVPAAMLPRADEASAAVTLEFPATGGHVGFVTGAFPGQFTWLPARLIEFFRKAL